MNRSFRALVAVLALAVGFAGPVIAEPFLDAAVAMQKHDYATALRLMRPLAEQGNASAQAILGGMYAYGRGVPQDYTVAMSWYRKAAEQGDVDAQSDLGIIYYSGRGVPQDYGAAAIWFRRAADQGDVAAQVSLGLMYFDGHGVPQDYILAHMWFNLAAAAGENRAAEVRAVVATLMTPAQIAKAQKLAREWKPKSSP
jgi:uncharacterized protein